MQLYRSYVRLLSAQFKWRSNIINPLFRNAASVRNILAPSDAVIYKPFHVFSKFQQAALHETCAALDKYHDFVPSEICFDGRNKIIIYNAKGFIHVFELNCVDNEIENYLVTQEFKHALSNLGFHYDVSVLNCHAIERQVLSNDLILFTASQPSITYIDFRLLASSNNMLLAETQMPQENSINQTEKPTEEKLIYIVNRLTNSYLNFFQKPQDFSFYRNDILFQNNFKGTKTKGLSVYKKQMYMLQIYGHLYFARVKIEILKITHHLDDATVRVRWRFNGLPRTKIVFQLWKLKSLPWTEFCDEESEWIDAFSIFSVDKNGLIYEHFCDKMIPDDDKVVKPETIRTKILTLLGVPGRPNDVGGIQAMVAYPSVPHLQEKIKKVEV